MSVLNKHVFIPKYLSPDIMGVSFGGFICDKYINSQPNSTQFNRFLNSAKGVNPGATPGISQIGVPIWDYITLPQAMIACANKGQSWHLMTPFEWASVVHLSYKYRLQPKGADNYPSLNSIDDLSEFGLADQNIKKTDLINRILPGTGPVSWSHNLQGTGIFDLFGLANQLIMGFVDINGYLLVPATDGFNSESSYGRGILSDSHISLVNIKEWTVNQYAGLTIYIAETDNFHTIQSNTKNSITLTGSVTGIGSSVTFCILQTISVDITAGDLSALPLSTSTSVPIKNIITTGLLKNYAIPDVAETNQNSSFINNSFNYTSSQNIQAIVRGGVTDRQFSLKTIERSTITNNIGFRACKSL